MPRSPLCPRETDLEEKRSLSVAPEEKDEFVSQENSQVSCEKVQGGEVWQLVAKEEDNQDCEKVQDRKVWYIVEE
mgnify:CR=1 FL=1